MTSRMLSFALLGFLFFSTPAQALHVTAGWTDSDVGLQERGNGFFAGVQDSWTLGTGLFEIIASGEYVQKAGSQMRLYSDIHSGLAEGEAKVKLHCLQTAAFLGVRLPVTGLAPRLYTGASVVLKMNESWDEPTGDTDGEYGYENMDFQVHLGLSLEAGRFLADARYSAGLVEQLIDGTSNGIQTDKAAEPELPTGGAKISSFQIGVGFAF